MRPGPGRITSRGGGESREPDARKARERGPARNMTGRNTVEEGEDGRRDVGLDHSPKAAAEGLSSIPLEMNEHFCGTTMSKAMELFVGPVIERDGHYCYDTFTRADGLRTSFRYRRVEQARYDRRVLMAESGDHSSVREFETLAAFEEAMAEVRALAETVGGFYGTRLI